jgi:hypothetical protein
MLSNRATWKCFWHPTFWSVPRDVGRQTMCHRRRPHSGPGTDAKTPRAPRGERRMIGRCSTDVLPIPRAPCVHGRCTGHPISLPPYRLHTSSLPHRPSQGTVAIKKRRSSPAARVRSWRPEPPRFTLGAAGWNSMPTLFPSRPNL